jgi:hypothetical protein
MTALAVVSAALLAASVIGFAVWLWRRMKKLRHLPAGRVFVTMGFGGVAAGASVLLETWALRFADVSLYASAGHGLAAALAMILFCAPLEEGLKALSVWPLYLNRRLVAGQVGAFYAVMAAAGFSAVEVIQTSLVSEGHWLGLVRSAFAAPAHLFFAGAWGYMLGGGRRDRFFTLLWLAAALLHGVYDHIVFGRGAALLVIVVPMLALMAIGVFGLLREQSNPNSSDRMTAYSLFEAPSVGSVREALSRRGRPVMLHWIVIGSFVNLGVTLTFLAASVYLGHRFGVDFSLVDEAGIEGILPIVILGSALLLAFPVSAYLIARASGAASVLEPAWATGASIVVVLALFSVTEPTALLIAIGIAPVGFTLACAGAWFGLDRR